MLARRPRDGLDLHQTRKFFVIWSKILCGRDYRTNSFYAAFMSTPLLFVVETYQSPNTEESSAAALPAVDYDTRSLNTRGFQA